MTDIDAFIEGLSESLATLNKAKSLAEAAHVPAEDRLALEQAHEALQAMVDRMYKLAASRGLDRDVPYSPIELKNREP